MNAGSKLLSYNDDDNINETESKRNTGKGGGPWFQPPGKDLWAVVSISVTRDRMAAAIRHRLPHIDVIKATKRYM